MFPSRRILDAWIMMFLPIIDVLHSTPSCSFRKTVHRLLQRNYTKNVGRGPKGSRSVEWPNSDSSLDLHTNPEQSNLSISNP
ncbi:hypothetical protein OF83DRAFT_869935 [Amylostereum chailletii]|nr:hypothetical protein OF83DRAFT_869935 [Amylostereum chailletii]